MKPIWYFVGLMLIVIGLILVTTGTYLLISPPEPATVLSEMHPNLWWGGILLVTGLIFTLVNRKKIVE